MREIRTLFNYIVLKGNRSIHIKYLPHKNPFFCLNFMEPKMQVQINSNLEDFFYPNFLNLLKQRNLNS